MNVSRPSLCQKSAGKKMASVFWDREVILLIDWIPEKKTMNKDYYITELEEVRAAIKSEGRGKRNRKVILQHDTARSHVSALTTMQLDVWVSNVSLTLPIVQTWLQLTTGCLDKLKCPLVKRFMELILRRRCRRENVPPMNFLP